MLTYLEKFNSLPEQIRDQVSAPSTMAAISELENKHGLSLAAVVMRVMVKDVSIVDLPKFFVFEFGIDGKQAKDLTDEMKTKVFGGVSEYLGIIQEPPPPGIDDSAQKWEDTKAGEAAIRSSAFFFSTEDEEEVKKLASNLSPAVSIPDKTSEYDSRINETIAKLNINFSSAELLKRYKNILTTYLRGVRNKVDAKQALAKGIDAGGLNMEGARIDSIFLVLDKVRDETSKIELPKPPVKIKVPEDGQAPMIKADQIDAIFKKDFLTTGARDVDYDFSKLASREKEATPAAAPATPASPVEVIVPESTPPEPVSPSAPIAPPETVNNNADTANSVDVIAAAPVIRRPKTGLGKMRMDDVKHVTKLTGPLDELGEMDTVSFRRMHDTPTDRIAIIKDKIHFLEEESYAQRLAGIKAWRQSPINKLYLDIGQESMNTGKPIEYVIEKRRSLNEDYISSPEFEAIMDLNKSLRY